MVNDESILALLLTPFFNIFNSLFPAYNETRDKRGTQNTNEYSNHWQGHQEGAGGKLPQGFMVQGAS